MDTSLQLVLDLLGVFVFGLSGALVAVRARFDIFGVLVLAWVTGLGGGIIRDVFLGDTPPVGITDWRLLTAAVSSGLLVFLLEGRYRQVTRHLPPTQVARIPLAVQWLDAVGLAVFAVSGAYKALGLGAEPLACIIIGGITAVGGGVFRDVLAGRVPEVLRRELYALPALFGAALVVAAEWVGALGPVTVWGSVVVVVVIRVLAVHLDLNAPRPLRTSRSREE